MLRLNLGTEEDGCELFASALRTRTLPIGGAGFVARFSAVWAVREVPVWTRVPNARVVAHVALDFDDSAQVSNKFLHL